VPTKEADEVIGGIRAGGAEVIALTADIARREDVENVLTHVARRMPALRGIVHAAGVLDDATLLTVSAEQLWRVLRPKILGAFFLHALTRELRLDFFVSYSSVASLFGAAGQANYAAANAFLDSLAHARVGNGLPAISIHWGPFTEVGMAATSGNRGVRLSARGVEGLSPAEGNVALGRLLAHPRAEVGIVRFAVRQWLDFHPQMAAVPFLSELADRPPDNGGRGELLAGLAVAKTAEWPRLIEAHVREEIGRVLRMDPHRIDASAPLRSLGVDSLMSLEVKNRLERSLGLNLPATLLYAYATIAVLAQYLAAELHSAKSAALVSRPGRIQPNSAESVEPSVDDDVLAAFDASARRVKQELLS
jgi:NAD(P)-dependent dehydrogenase (short-subunit alcohol dehydrogenase family)/acyl carrier protein